MSVWPIGVFASVDAGLGVALARDQRVGCPDDPVACAACGQSIRSDRQQIAISVGRDGCHLHGSLWWF